MKLITLFILFTTTSLCCVGQNLSVLISNTDSLLQKYHVEFISFGTFCGMCDFGEQVNIFHYDTRKKGTLLQDTTHNYFTTHDKKFLIRQITDTNKIKLAKSIIENIPISLFESDSTTQTFGCPDCFDGGGIFIEIGHTNKTKIIYVDLDADKLQFDIKRFVALFKTKFKEIKKKK